MQERPPRSDGERTVISMLNDCLFLCTPLVPLLDRLLPGARFHWQRSAPSPQT